MKDEHGVEYLYDEEGSLNSDESKDFRPEAITSRELVAKKSRTSYDSQRSSHRNSLNSRVLSGTKTNHSELSRFMTTLRDEYHLDHDEHYQKSTQAEVALADELEKVSRRSTRPTTREQSRKGSFEKKHDEKEEVQDISVDTEEKLEEKIHDPKLDSGYAWVVAVCTMFCIVCSWGPNSGYGVFLSYYISHDTFKGATQYDYSLIGGLVMFFAQGMAPISVMTYRVFGFYICCFLGVFIQSCGYILASFATKLWQLYLTQGVLVGLGFVFIYIPPTVVLATYFKKYRAFAFGIAVGGAGVGGVLFSLSVNKVIEDTGNQRWALRMCCFVTLAIAIVAILMIRPRDDNTPIKQRLNANYIKEAAKVIFNFKLFKKIPIMVLALWYGIVMLGYILMLFSISSFASLIGLLSKQGTSATAIMNAGQAIGRPIIGISGDKVGRSNLVAGVCLVSSILLWAFWINVNSYGSLCAFSIVIGLFIGVGPVSCQPLAADILESPKDLPAAWAGLNMIVSFFCLTAEVIALAMRKPQLPKPFLHIQIFSGACFFFCFLLVLIVREALVRNRLKARLEHLKMGSPNQGTEDSTKSGETEGYLPEEEILRNRAQRYERLLGRNPINYFLRMFYPVRI